MHTMQTIRRARAIEAGLDVQALVMEFRRREVERHHETLRSLDQIQRLARDGVCRQLEGLLPDAA